MELLRLLWRWRRERFRLRRYGPFALMLAGPALDFQPSLWMLWALSLLLQLRLADDLGTLAQDKLLHPTRVLVSWKGLGPYGFLFGISFLNTLPLWNQSFLPLFLYLIFFLTLSPIFPAFLRYASLVVLLDTTVCYWRQETWLHSALVATAASAFELGHDPFSGAFARGLYIVLVLLPCLSIKWTPLWLLPVVMMFSALALLRLSPRIGTSPTRRFLCAASSYPSVALIAASLFP